jgi:hypothetical protein
MRLDSLQQRNYFFNRSGLKDARSFRGRAHRSVQAVDGARIARGRFAQFLGGDML